MAKYFSAVLIIALATVCLTVSGSEPPATVKLSDIQEVPEDELKGRLGLLLGLAGALLGGGGRYNRGYQQNQYTHIRHTTTEITHANSQRGFNNGYYSPHYNRFYRAGDDGVLTMVTDPNEVKAFADIMDPKDNTKAQVNFG